MLTTVYELVSRILGLLNEYCTHPLGSMRDLLMYSLYDRPLGRNGASFRTSKMDIQIDFRIAVLSWELDSERSVPPLQYKQFGNKHNSR